MPPHCLSQPSNQANRATLSQVRRNGFLTCCLSLLTYFRILYRLVCLLCVQKVIVFQLSQVILLRFGRCTVYLRWSIVSWKNWSLRFCKREFWKCLSPRMVHLCCLSLSLMFEVFGCVLIIGL